MSPEKSPALLSALAARSFPGVLEAALDHFGCQAGTLHILSGEGLRLVAHMGLPPPIIRLIETVPVGKGIAGLAAARRAPVTICNLQEDTSGQALPAARTTGLEGSIAVPMLTEGGELRGVLGIAKAVAHVWTPEESAALSAMARAACVLVEEK